MSQEIYNEGRVVGLSAYEIFLKNLFADDPNAAITPPTEAEWLASMIGIGNSMVLKIPEGVSGVHDYQLPSNSNLIAAGVIVASVFDGDCDWTLSEPYWATKVTSYGGLIANTDSTHSPTAVSVPADPDSFVTPPASTNRKRLYAEFAKVTDGIFIQPGKVTDGWVETGDSPYKDLHHPDYNKQGIIRLYIEEALSCPIYILFTGFINKGVIQGISHTSGSTDPDTNNWRNGGMLGPEVFPWSSKILFAIPNGTYYSDGSYIRTFPKDGEVITSPVGSYTFNADDITGEVKSHAVADFKSINLNQYYSLHYPPQGYDPDPRLSVHITSLATGSKDDICAFTAWYPGMSTSRLVDVAQETTPDNYFFPPALYAVKTSTVGDHMLVPLDTAAPGTIKVFEDDAVAYSYTQQNPNNYAIYHTYDTSTNTDISYFVSKDSGPNVSAWQAMTAKLSYSTTNDGIDYTKIVVGDKSYETVSLSAPDGSRRDIDGADGTYGINMLTQGFSWSDLLKALHNNYYIDPVGDKLRAFNVGLPNVVTVNDNYVSVGAAAMNEPATGSTMKYVDGEMVFNKAPRSGTEYYVFTNSDTEKANLRLYIANTEPDPAGVPIGSIGIGW